MVPGELGQLFAQATGLRHQLYLMTHEWYSIQQVRHLFGCAGFVVGLRFHLSGAKYRKFRKPVSTQVG